MKHDNNKISDTLEMEDIWRTCWIKFVAIEVNLEKIFVE